MQLLEDKFLKENVNRDFLNHKLLETGGLRKTVRVDNCALGSPQLIWKADVTAKIWLQRFRLESSEVTDLDGYSAY